MDKEYTAKLEELAAEGAISTTDTIRRADNPTSSPISLS